LESKVAETAFCSDVLDSDGDGDEAARVTEVGVIFGGAVGEETLAKATVESDVRIVLLCSSAA